MKAAQGSIRASARLLRWRRIIPGYLSDLHDALPQLTQLCLRHTQPALIRQLREGCATAALSSAGHLDRRSCERE